MCACVCVCVRACMFADEKLSADVTVEQTEEQSSYLFDSDQLATCKYTSVALPPNMYSYAILDTIIGFYILQDLRTSIVSPSRM